MNLITKQAIDFTAKAVMPDDKICEFNLKQYISGKYAILVFYPRDFTFVCPTEIISLHNRIPQFIEKNTEIIGISTDSEFCHSHWRNISVNKGGIDKISFPLIADDSHSISNNYGVLYNNSIALRATFIIDDHFIVRHQSINDLPIGRNVDELLRIIDAIKHHQIHGEVCPAGWIKGDPAMEASQHGIEDYLKSHIDNLEKRSGAAGCTAAIYAARANLQPILITGMCPGGQLTITTDVENFPGFAHAVQGPNLMEQMQQQAYNSGAKIISDEIKEIRTDMYPFECIGIFDDHYIANSIIIATGAQAKWLNIESEEAFKGKGVSACATCDGVFFSGSDVAVVGGGNTAVEEALYLTRHATKVFLIHRRDKLRAEPILQKRLFSNDKIQVIWNSSVKEILGNKENGTVEKVILESTNTGNTTTLPVKGVFIAIGHAPNTKILKKPDNTNIVSLDDEGYIITNPNSTVTSCPGIFAAGDVQDKIYRQAVVAAGSGCMAAIEAAKFLSDN